MKTYFFVLGAPDHEMQEIARICEERGLAFGFATVGGNIVHSHEAYQANGVTALIPVGAHQVFVECAVMGLRPDDIIDHHHQGDPGYGMPPEQYFEGSSLGQFLRFIGVNPTQQQLVIAAADHCLTSAYQGRCPGVTPEELAAWRIASRCRARGLTEVELHRQIDHASKLLEAAPRISLAGEQVAFIEEPPTEVSEASARLGMPYIYVRRQDAKQLKAGIRSAPAHLVQAWMDNCGLARLYGDPQRGFAGGYLPRH
ncbi:hypothetical protein WDL1P1_00818 (plasmid) [Variovorax sp. WDL1]|nr:hypothetical protein APY03_0572 [Variovorax sp. WDL1]PNG49894.1 hypothetical protein CHC06_05475 [Variovorax sp. B2]PNG50766.1 hypothetical protein CHC07_05380 [Variovorax sp. B4]VTV17980.1 hypothetical protein WDL1P1_00818 [Variovorax sp. WDL1]